MILVCAATRPELDACTRGIGASAAASGGFETLLVGIGPDKAARTLRERLASGARPRRIVSSGFGGAIGGGLSRGAWITASRLFELDASDALVPLDVTPVTIEASAPTVISVDVVSAPRIVTSESPLHRARRDAPLVADMESAALAKVAATHGVAFSVLRVISDTPDEALPGFVASFTNAIVDRDPVGRLGSIARGLGGVLRDPGGVARLVRDGRAATDTLADGWRALAANDDAAWTRASTLAEGEGRRGSKP